MNGSPQLFPLKLNSYFHRWPCATSLQIFTSTLAWELSAI